MSMVDNFLNNLKTKLSHHSHSEVERILDYYKECIDDMLEDEMSEEDIVKSFGDIDTIIKNINEEMNEVKTDKRTKKLYSFNGNYEKIELSDINTKITVTNSDSEEIILTTFESKDEFYEIVESNVLSINYKNSLGFFGRLFTFFSFSDKHYLELKIPKRIVCDFDISSKNNKIVIEKVAVNNLKVINRNGETNIQKTLCINEFYAKNTNGAFDIKDFTTKSAYLKTINGATKFDKINITDEIFSESINGKITAENIQIGNKATFKNINGATKIDLIDDPQNYSFDINSKNGKVTIGGNNVLNAENSIYFANGDKKLKIKSINGGIKLNLK